MSKAVLISIQPYWVFLIIAKAMGWNIDKEKTIEVRKSRPKAESWNKVAKIYCSKDKKSFNEIPKEYQPFMKPLLGKVIGEFVCQYIEGFRVEDNGGIPNYKWCSLDESCVRFDDIVEYIGKGKIGYAWDISDLIIYDEPKELSEFYRHDTAYDNSFGGYFEDRDKLTPIKRPPQSWCYVEEV